MGCVGCVCGGGKECRGVWSKLLGGCRVGVRPLCVCVCVCKREGCSCVCICERCVCAYVCGGMWCMYMCVCVCVCVGGEGGDFSASTLIHIGMVCG